jgi:acyl carrier protein
LTLRTNQFNFTTIRRSENDVIGFLERETGRCLAAKVSDRFGDYGMVGLLLYDVNGDRYDVDTFLLSCRVLGRGVEHQILAKFGRLALDRGKQWIDFPFRPTDKNQPAWEFIKSVGAEFMRQANDGAAFLFPAARLAGLRYDPDLPLAGAKRAGQNGSAGTESTPGSAVAAAITGLSEKFQQIADGLNGVKEICAAIETYRLRAAGGGGTSAGGELPATLAGRMLGIWRKAIGNPRVGMNDNFVDVGGTSLKAVQVVAAIRRELHLHLSIVSIFECPTVRLLCEKLEPAKATGGSASDAMERGARRKQRAQRRA